MAEDCCCQHSGRRQTRSFSKAWRWKSWHSAQQWLGWEARKAHQHTYFGGQFSNGIYQSQGCQQHFFLMTLSLGQARRLIMWWIAGVPNHCENICLLSACPFCPIMDYKMHQNTTSVGCCLGTNSKTLAMDLSYPLYILYIYYIYTICISYIQVLHLHKCQLDCMLHEPRFKERFNATKGEGRESQAQDASQVLDAACDTRGPEGKW